MGSHSREDLLPARLGRRGEVQTLKNKWENFVTSQNRCQWVNHRPCRDCKNWQCLHDSELGGCFMGVHEPMELCVILSVHMCVSLGLQLIAFISSQRLRIMGLVQPTHYTREKLRSSWKRRYLLRSPSELGIKRSRVLLRSLLCDLGLVTSHL